MALLTQNSEHIIEICTVLAQQENLKVTVQQSCKGALYTGCAVFVGGVLGGPIGMAVGGTITSIAVAASARGKFKSLIEIIDEMTDEQKNRLTQAVQKAIKNIKPEDCVGLLTLVLTTPSVKELVLLEISAFLKKEMQLQLIR